MAISNKNGHAVTSVLPAGSAHNAVSPAKPVFKDQPQSSRKMGSKGGYPPKK